MTSDHHGRYVGTPSRRVCCRRIVSLGDFFFTPESIRGILISVTIPWKKAQLRAVNDGLKKHPLTSGRCAALARIIHKIAISTDPNTHGIQLRPPGAARFLVPKRADIPKWVDQRIEDMLAAPRMWGSDEAVELQVLLLLEIRTLALRPEELAADPRCILDAYAAYLTKTYPAKPNRPLSQIVETDHLGLELAAALRPFRDLMVKKYGAKKLVLAKPKDVCAKR